jgi:hypothetical protein
MADPKKDDAAKTEPAPGDVGTERSTNDAQYSSSVDEDVVEEAPPKTYYLRENAEHHHILKGEARALNRFGQKAELSDEQYAAFKDKFLTEAEYKAAKAGKEALAEGASAAEVLPGQTERASIEEAGAANNEPSGKPNPAGQPGKPA